MKESFEYEYKFVETVYHQLTGNKGIVVDVIYYAMSKTVRYIVVFGLEDASCLGIELGKEKPVL